MQNGTVVCEQRIAENGRERKYYVITEQGRKLLAEKLKDHIEDRAEEYCADGLSRSEAVKKAVDAMGDGISVGAEINAVRRVRTNRLLVILTALFMASGLAAEILLEPYPDIAAYRGVTYYLAGTALLLFTMYESCACGISSYGILSLRIMSSVSESALCTRKLRFPVRRLY